MPVAHKRRRIQSCRQYLFTLLGSTGAKAALKIKMLMKLTLGYPCINWNLWLRTITDFPIDRGRLGRTSRRVEQQWLRKAGKLKERDPIFGRFDSIWRKFPDQHDKDLHRRSQQWERHRCIQRRTSRSFAKESVRRHFGLVEFWRLVDKLRHSNHSSAESDLPSKCRILCRQEWKIAGRLFTHHDGHFGMEQSEYEKRKH